MPGRERSMRDLALDTLPLLIERVDFAPDPVLSRLGDGWSGTLMCDWRTAGPAIAMSWDDDYLPRDRDAGDLAFLTGRSIEDISSGLEMIEPCSTCPVAPGSMSTPTTTSTRGRCTHRVSSPSATRRRADRTTKPPAPSGSP